MNWPRAPWWMGSVTLVLFLLSGAFMRWVARVPELEDLTRSVFRSRHLFIMLAALANLALASDLSRSKSVTSTLVLMAPLFLLIAFWVEPGQGINAGPWSQLGLYALFGAAALLAIANRPRR